MLKPSFYNMFFPDGTKFLLFNTLRNSLLVVDKEVKEALEQGSLDKLPDNFIRLLEKNGVLVDSDLDEKKALHYQYERLKYQSGHAAFHIITTYACNLACSYCFEGMGRIASSTMSAAQSARVVKFIEGITLENNCRSLTAELYGGEPLLNFDVGYDMMKELSDWAEENGIHFSTNAITNGTLITEDVADKLSELKSSLLVTLDGPKQIHDSRRMHKNGKGTFDEIIRGLTIAKAHKLPIKIRINVDKENRSEVPSLLEELKSDLSDTVISIKTVFNSSPACLSYSPSFDDCEGAMVSDELYDLARSMGFRTEENHSLPKINVCGGLHSSVFTIDPDGRLFKCAVLPPYNEFSAGEVDNGGRPVYNSLFYDIMSRDPLTMEDCDNCKLVPVCSSGCFAMALQRYGTLEKSCAKEAMMEMLRKGCVRNRGENMV